MTTVTAITALARFYRTVTPIEDDSIIDFNAEFDRVIGSRPPDRKGASFWPSTVNSPFSCPRREALMRIEGVWTDKVRTSPDRIKLMNVGSALHDLVQNELLGPGGRLWGGWRCPRCQEVIHVNTTYPADERCPNVLTITRPETLIEQIEGKRQKPKERRCADTQAYLLGRGRPIWEYAEIRLADGTVDLRGRVDGIFLVGGYWYTLEIKTVDSLAFRDLSEVALKSTDDLKVPKKLEGRTVLAEAYQKLPRPYQVNQGSIYSEMILREAAEGRIPIDPEKYRGTFIVYVDRETLKARWFLRRHSATAYQAARNTIENVSEIVDQADTEVRSDPEAERERVEANRKVAMRIGKACRTRTDKRAKECPWQTVCFPYKDARKNRVTFVT